MEFPNIYCQYMYSYPHKTAYGSLPDLSISDYIPKEGSAPFSLYLHIPFCESKCGYCNLFSVTGQNIDFYSLYLDAVERQAIQYQNAIDKSRNRNTSIASINTNIDTNKNTSINTNINLNINTNINTNITSAYHGLINSLVLGGGTPLILSESQLERLFSIAQIFPLIENADIVVETSPRQTTKEKLQILKQHNVTRISIGIQSFHDKELSALYRKHTVKDCEKALSLIDASGFSCRNIDLIYGIPGQTKQSLQYSLDRTCFYQPEEIFLYPLYIKQGTGLFYGKAEVSVYAYDMYLSASQYLKEHGYCQISMRRFVKESEVCCNNSKHSCGFEHTLSLGCGGRSYLQNLHFCTPYHIQPSSCLQEIKNFIKQKDYSKISFGYLLNGDEMLRRFVIKNLLHKNGIAVEDYCKAKQIFEQYQYDEIHKISSINTSILKDFPIIAKLLENHFAVWNDHRIVLTEQGLSLSDAIGPLFISENVREKMNQWTEERD